MDDLDLQADQQLQEKRGFLDDWEKMQRMCPEFCERLQSFAYDWEQSGLNNLYTAKNEHDQVNARAQVVAGRAMARLFTIADNIQNEFDQINEEMH